MRLHIEGQDSCKLSTHNCLNFMWDFNGLHVLLSKHAAAIHYIWVFDQAWGQDGWILVKFFFGMFMDWDRVEVHKLEKRKEQGHYPAILTEKAWSIT